MEWEGGYFFNLKGSTKKIYRKSIINRKYKIRGYN